MQETNGAVSVTRVGAITVVTLSRPDVRNAVDAATAQALHAAFCAFDADPGARVAVFHREHGHFCAGWDLQAGARLAAQREGGADPFAALEFSPQDVQPAGPMGPSRLHLSKPVLAAISGAAVAGGMELALWCDLRVMEEDAYFGVYCRRFGVPLIDGGTVRLPRLVGMGRALDLILTGRPVCRSIFAPFPRTATAPRCSISPDRRPIISPCARSPACAAGSSTNTACSPAGAGLLERPRRSCTPSSASRSSPRNSGKIAAKSPWPRTTACPG